MQAAWLINAPLIYGCTSVIIYEKIRMQQRGLTMDRFALLRTLVSKETINKKSTSHLLSLKTESQGNLKPSPCLFAPIFKSQQYPAPMNY